MLDKIKNFITVTEAQKQLLVEEFIATYKHGQVFFVKNRYSGEEFYLLDKESKNAILVPMIFPMDSYENYYSKGHKGIDFSTIKELVEVSDFLEALNLAKRYRRQYISDRYTGFGYRSRRC